VSSDKLVADIVNRGSQGIAAALNNGLTDDDNQELFRCTQAPRISELILKGLSRVGGP
jgi:hypothetical protein